MGTSSPDLVEEMFYVTTWTMSSRHVHVLTFRVHKQSVQSAFLMKSTHTVYAMLYTRIAKTVTANLALRARGFSICARVTRETNRRVFFRAAAASSLSVTYPRSKWSDPDWISLRWSHMQTSTDSSACQHREQFCFCLPAEQFTCAHFYAVLIMRRRSR